MATTRDQLIADWRERLASAEEPQPADSQRAAWLARLRVRLYRFLLSLYGEGEWNAPGPLGPELRNNATASIGIESDALPFVGKPAKDECAIRSVLQSVAGARQHPPEVGPLAGGIDREAWVTIASASEGLDPQLCANVLNEAGISPLLVGRYADTTVSVPIQHQMSASRLIASRRSYLRLRPIERVQSRSSNAAKRQSELFWLGAPLLMLCLALWLNLVAGWLGVTFESIAGFAFEPGIWIDDLLASEQSLRVMAVLLMLGLEVMCLCLLRHRRIKQRQ